MARILVVDDSPTALGVIGALLAGAGHEPVCCGAAKIALEKLQRESFDLIVTDIYMPERDGLEFIRDSRRLYPRLPIIAISDPMRHPDMLAAARMMGAARTLPKLRVRAELLKTVAELLPARPTHDHS